MSSLPGSQRRGRASAWSMLRPGPRSALPQILTWAPLGPADNADLAALIARCETVDDPPYRTTAEETAEYFADPVYSGVAGRDEHGAMRAFGLVRLRPSEKVYASITGIVDPAWRRRGIGGSLLHWQTENARHLIGAERANALERLEARIVANVLENDERFATHLAELGFTPRRWYREVRRDLAEPIADVELDRFLEIVPWTEDLDDTVRRAHNNAFGGGWGADVATPEEWQAGRAYFAPRWSFVALDRSSDRTQVAGYLLSGRYEQDWEALGWQEGYTDMLGVGGDHRRRHVGRALLTAAMRAYAADGMDYAAAGVDSDNPTGAVSLYESLGYVPTEGTVLYSLEV